LDELGNQQKNSCEKIGEFQITILFYLKAIYKENLRDINIVQLTLRLKD